MRALARGLLGLLAGPASRGLAGKFTSGENGGANLCVFMHIANSGFRVRVRQFLKHIRAGFGWPGLFFRGDLRAFGTGVAYPTALHTNPEGWRISGVGSAQPVSRETRAVTPG